jgi:hypothetical protein
MVSVRRRRDCVQFYGAVVRGDIVRDVVTKPLAPDTVMVIVAMLWRAAWVMTACGTSPIGKRGRPNDVFLAGLAPATCQSSEYGGSVHESGRVPFVVPGGMDTVQRGLPGPSRPPGC